MAELDFWSKVRPESDLAMSMEISTVLSGYLV